MLCVTTRIDRHTNQPGGNVCVRAGTLRAVKGTKEEPRCGFSRKVVAAITATGTPFETFDILSDEVGLGSHSRVSDKLHGLYWLSSKYEGRYKKSKCW
jgi:hypothetical protein